MQLEKLSVLFSNEISHWPIANPSKALPFYMKAFIKNSVGKTILSQDVSHKYEPNRMGIWTRQFQTGDPLKTISLSHLIRFNLFITKMEKAPGRENILVLFHRYENMTYLSQNSTSNKGQVANAICAILEQVHLNLGQKFTIKTLDGPHFFKSCQKILHSNHSFDKIYFISDFLFNSNSITSASEELEKTIKYFNIKKNTFIFVRDQSEITTENRTSNNFELSPWDQKKDAQKKFFATFNFVS